jgi:phosphoribosylformylglycinamidine synthase
MIVLYGSSVFFPNRRDALLADLKTVLPSIVSIDVVHTHLISCISDKAEAELNVLESKPRYILDHLLAYGDDFSLSSSGSALTSGIGVAYVIPRPGSVSPWSSKATDIALLCGLKGYVERLERGAAFVFTPAISQSQLDRVAPLIHDRMTQIVSLTLPSQDSIFRHASPSPLRSVALSKSPDAREKLERANKELGLALASDEIVSIACIMHSHANIVLRRTCSMRLSLDLVPFYVIQLMRNSSCSRKLTQSIVAIRFLMPNGPLMASKKTDLFSK